MSIRHPMKVVCLLVLGLCLSAVGIFVAKGSFVGYASARASFRQTGSQYRAFAKIHTTHPRGPWNLNLHTHRGTYYVWAECPQGSVSTSRLNKPKTGGIFLRASPISNSRLEAQSEKYGNQNSGIAIAWIEVEDHFSRTRSDSALAAPE